jgi:hypothetical protein
MTVETTLEHVGKVQRVVKGNTGLADSGECAKADSEDEPVLQNEEVN